jgi:hypothetical protein
MSGRLSRKKSRAVSHFVAGWPKIEYKDADSWTAVWLRRFRVLWFGDRGEDISMVSCVRPSIQAAAVHRIGRRSDCRRAIWMVAIVQLSAFVHAYRELL